MRPEFIWQHNWWRGIYYRPHVPRPQYRQSLYFHTGAFIYSSLLLSLKWVEIFSGQKAKVISRNFLSQVSTCLPGFFLLFLFFDPIKLKRDWFDIQRNSYYWSLLKCLSCIHFSFRRKPRLKKASGKKKDKTSTTIYVPCFIGNKPPFL